MTTAPMTARPAVFGVDVVLGVHPGILELRCAVDGEALDLHRGDDAWPVDEFLRRHQQCRRRHAVPAISAS